MRACRLTLLLCFSVLGGAGVPQVVAAPVPAASGADLAGQDMSGADVFGVRLYMDQAEARDALRLTLPGEAGWRDTRIPCADEQGRGSVGPRSCLASSVLAGPTGVVLRYVEDLPARPHRSIVAEAVASQEPRDDRSKQLFHQALLRKYGRPDLRDPTGMQWGQLALNGGRPVLVRTLPMLESSNDEIIRLSDSGLGERQAGRTRPGATPASRHAGQP